MFGILQAVAAAADKGKPMSIDDVVAQYGDDEAKRAHAERKRASDPSQADGADGGGASAAGRAVSGAATGGDDGEDGGEEDDEPVDEIEGGGEAMPEDKAGAAALWSQPLVQASKVKEAFVLFAGGRTAGKSSLVASFLGTGRPDSSSSSSSALEYAFGRKSGSSARDAAKMVAHCWELAGGTKLRTLTQVPLTTQRLPNATIVLTASLAAPAAVLPLLLRWLPLLRARCAECVTKLRRKSSRHATALEARALKRVVGDGHPDA